MTYVTLRRPAANLFKLHNRPWRIFQHPFVYQGMRTVAGEHNWSPSVDIAETDDSFEVRAELPGVTQDDIQVSVKENRLTLKGEKRQEQVDDSKNYRRVERPYGRFQRAFTLPPTVKADDIKAEFKDGVLTLDIPKAEEAKPTEIPIRVNA